MSEIICQCGHAAQGHDRRECKSVVRITPGYVRCICQKSRAEVELDHAKNLLLSSKIVLRVILSDAKTGEFAMRLGALVKEIEDFTR